MMTPFITLPSTQAPLPVQTAAVVGVPTEVGYARLSVNAVPSTVAVQQVYNNSRYNGAPRSQTAAAEAAAAASAEADSMTEALAAPIARFFTPFLAQLLAQAAPGEADALAALYANDNIAGDTLDAHLMQAFSLVKYKPSFASVPRPEPQNVIAISLNQAAPAAPKPQTAPTQQTTAETSAARQPAPEATERVTRPAAEVVTAAQHAAPRSRQKPVYHARSAFIGKPMRSLIKHSGVDAYIASFTRNHVNIAKPEAEASAVL